MNDIEFCVVIAARNSAYYKLCLILNSFRKVVVVIMVDCRYLHGVMLTVINEYVFIILIYSKETM